MKTEIQMCKNRKYTENTQYTSFNVETLNRGNTTNNRESLYKRYTEENRLQHSLYPKCVSHTGLLAYAVTQLWHRSLTLTLVISYTLPIHNMLCSPVHDVLPQEYILIHNIGLFTNIALNGTLTLFAKMSLSRLRPIRLLSESTSI